MPAAKSPHPEEVRSMNATPACFSDPHAELRALYISLLRHQEHFDEFKQLLALYVAPTTDAGAEPDDAARVRARLNTRIQTWIGGPFGGLSASQVIQWRAIVVEDRFNVSLSPWKESNVY
jgi:hypothetical protein